MEKGGKERMGELCEEGGKGEEMIVMAYIDVPIYDKRERERERESIQNPPSFTPTEAFR